MLPKAYIETSVVSYLTAKPSRDLVRAAHQQVTREWWATRDGFETRNFRLAVRDRRGRGG